MEIQQAQQQPMQHAPPQHAGVAGVSSEITHGPSFSLLRIDLQPGQLVIAEAGAMVARHQQVQMEVKMNAGRNPGFFGAVAAFFIAIIRRVIGGETFFVNHFQSPQGGSVWIAPALSGNITHRRLNGESITLSTGAFLASSGNIDMKLKFGGLRGLFAKEGLFFLEVFGQGDIWFTSYGGVEAIDVNGSYIVDNGHIVGWEGPLTFNIQSAGGGLMGFFASGEGLVCKFEGQGRLYIQTRNLGALASWLMNYLPH